MTTAGDVAREPREPPSLTEQNQPMDSNTVNGTANSPAQLDESKRKLRSPISVHFTLETVKGKQMAVCKYCKRSFA